MISVIVPIYNEAGNLTSLLAELNKSLAEISAGYEILAVDDGSTDNSLTELKKLKKLYGKLNILSLRKNFGKSVALMVGFTKSKGDIVVTIDADGQDVPSEIAVLLKEINKGFDVAVGWRKNRSDSFIKKMSSSLWNKLLYLFSGIKLHDVNCGLKVFKKEVLNSRYFLGDFHRYLPVAVAMDGYRVTEVTVKHRPRLKGISKYNYSRIFPAVFDFFTNMFLARYGLKPMHLFGQIGVLIIIPGLLINMYLLVLKISGNAIGGRPLLILGLLMTISGLQFIFTGLLGDLIIRNKDLSITEYLENDKQIFTK